MHLRNTGNAAGVEIVNCIMEAGIKPDERDLSQLSAAIKTIGGLSREEIQEMIDAALASRPAAYALCEFYYFRNPDLRPGFRHAYGERIDDAATLYPLAWDFLQSPEGQTLCITEDEWQAMSTATWHTLADGTEIGWEGVGGVPFYVLDAEAQTLRLPDLRGMYAEAAGFDSLGVGGVHGDGIREIKGGLIQIVCNVNGGSSGAFSNGSYSVANTTSGNQNIQRAFSFTASRVVPTSNKNQPRAWGALPCVYLGA